jgi:hypothetical protein
MFQVIQLSLTRRSIFFIIKRKGKQKETTNCYCTSYRGTLGEKYGKQRLPQVKIFSQAL